MIIADVVSYPVLMSPLPPWQVVGGVNIGVASTGSFDGGLSTALACRVHWSSQLSSRITTVVNGRINGRSMALVLLENGLGLGLDQDLSLIITPPGRRGGSRPGGTSSPGKGLRARRPPAHAPPGRRAG